MSRMGSIRILKIAAEDMSVTKKKTLIPVKDKIKRVPQQNTNHPCHVTPGRPGAEATESAYYRNKDNGKWGKVCVI